MITIPGVTETVQKALKEYRCDYDHGCGGIKVGETYVRQAVAPWVPVVDDVDDEGHSIAHPQGEWMIQRFHDQCQLEVEVGGVY